MRLYLLIVAGALLSSTKAQETDLNRVETTTLYLAQEDNAEGMTTASTIDRSSHVHIDTPALEGFWKKKFAWRPRWVKTWQPKKVYVAVWKRMWSPAVTKEWVPIPKPPPGWVKRKAFGNVFVRIG